MQTSTQVFRLLPATHWAGKRKYQMKGEKRTKHFCGPSHPYKKPMHAIKLNLAHSIIYIIIKSYIYVRPKNQLHVQAHLKALTRVESIPSSIGELQYRFKSRQSIRALFRWKLPLNWLLPNTRASVGKNRTGRIRIIASRAKTGHKKKTTGRQVKASDP